MKFLAALLVVMLVAVYTSYAQPLGAANSMQSGNNNFLQMYMYRQMFDSWLPALFLGQNGAGGAGGAGGMFSNPMFWLYSGMM